MGVSGEREWTGGVSTPLVTLLGESNNNIKLCILSKILTPHYYTHIHPGSDDVNSEIMYHVESSLYLIIIDY